MQTSSAQPLGITVSEAVSDLVLQVPDSHSLPPSSDDPSVPELGLGVASGLTEFRSRFTDCMEMYAEPAQVALYLDNHQEWFRRCAHPMQTEPIGQNGYALGLGKFGALGYDIEPQIGLDLLPQDEGIYRIRTVEVPDYHPQGYEVDFQAALELKPLALEGMDEAQIVQEAQALGMMTRVEWVLDLGVHLQFPRFIRALPQALIKTTGDRLLYEIVRQISRRLTRKVQEDFHRSLGLPMPDRNRHQFTKL